MGSITGKRYRQQTPLSDAEKTLRDSLVVRLTEITGVQFSATPSNLVEIKFSGQSPSDVRKKSGPVYESVYKEILQNAGYSPQTPELKRPYGSRPGSTNSPFEYRCKGNEVKMFIPRRNYSHAAAQLGM